MDADHLKPLEWVCRTAEQLLGVDAACVSLIIDGTYRGALCAADPVLSLVESAQFSLAQGPCFEAIRTRAPVLVADFAQFCSGAWPVFASEVAGESVGAFFAFPLPHGQDQLGALAMYRVAPGPLSPGVLGAASSLADLAAMALVASPVTDPDSVDLDNDLGCEDQAPDSAWMETALHDHGELNRAAGLLMDELHIDAAQAVDRLRGYAFATHQPLSKLAAQVTNHRIHPRALGS